MRILNLFGIGNSEILKKGRSRLHWLVNPDQTAASCR